MLKGIIVRRLLRVSISLFIMVMCNYYFVFYLIMPSCEPCLYILLMSYPN